MRSMLMKLTAAAFGFSLSAAQSATTTSQVQTTGTATISATTHTVSVGVNNAYQPDTIKADVGDIIEFIFWPTNHSVVRADFLNPCVPYYWFHEDGPTFFSGPELSQSTSNHPKWHLLINDTEPTFFYCSAPSSCINDHMVGVINPNDTFTLAKQQAALQGLKFQLSPGEPWPPESPQPTATSSTSPSPTSSSTTTTSTPAVASGGSSGGSTLSAGAIAGIAIGGAAVLIIAIALVWVCGRKGGIEKGYRRSTAANPAPAPMIEANYENNPHSPPQGSHPNSPFGIRHPESYRSSSPAQWSQTGSPHNSYMGYPSPGLQSPYKEAHPQVAALQDQHKPAPVELPENPRDPGSPPPPHEFPG